MNHTRVRRRVTRPAGPPDPTRCRCQPVLVATFTNAELVALHRRHWRTGDPAVRRGEHPNCGHPNEAVDIGHWRV